MVQEIYDTHPAIREACNRSISGHAATLLADIEESMLQRGMRPEWAAESLALYTQATLQGAFILAKARVVLRLRRSASIICGGTSSCCSNHRRVPRRPGHREFRQQSPNGAKGEMIGVADSIAWPQEATHPRAGEGDDRP